ncbi:Alpha/Beta hydrolase protein [Phaeosphaeriaceae sp. PMI808]|nr:Alpha/Beta hydrolase protein [Phaeosphaeriaceae sp. PMI808]
MVMCCLLVVQLERQLHVTLKKIPNITSINMPYKFDPEIEAVLKARQENVHTSNPVAVYDVITRRRNFEAMMASIEAKPVALDVATTSYSTTTTDGHELQLHWYRKSTSTPTVGPAVLFIRGGGMILGSHSHNHVKLTHFVSHCNVPFLAVDYRLAPENPHPTPVEDCYAGLVWLRHHAKDLDIDLSRIAILGESAGGGIAAGVALMARDRDLRPPLAKQILVYPMLDDRTLIADKALSPFLIWDYDSNITGWSALLGRDIIGTENVSHYAVPARATNLSNLPPTFIDVGTLDLFRNEDIEYARRLAMAQVEVEFHLYPGVPHGFELIAPNAEVSRRAVQNRVLAVQSF